MKFSFDDEHFCLDHMTRSPNKYKQVLLPETEHVYFFHVVFSGPNCLYCLCKKFT